MRTYFYSVLLVFTSHSLYAQDTLYMADGSQRLAKILEVSETQVKYKLWTDSEGPTHVISKDDVSRILYETGVIATFPVKPPAPLNPKRRPDPRATDFGRHFISIDVIDLFQNSLTFGYEYTFRSGYSSLKIPLTFRRANDGPHDENKIIGTGLDFYLYPFGQGEAKFFYGPSFEYVKYEKSDYYFDINSAYIFLFKAGFLLQPWKHVNASVSGGLGYSRLITNSSQYNYGEIAYSVALNIGYKF